MHATDIEANRLTICRHLGAYEPVEATNFRVLTIVRKQQHAPDHAASEDLGVSGLESDACVVRLQLSLQDDAEARDERKPESVLFATHLCTRFKGDTPQKYSLLL